MAFELCDFYDACDFCKEPEGKVFAKMYYSDVEEAEYYICEKCIFEKIERK